MVEWFGDNSEEYVVFFIIFEKFLFEEIVRIFLELGVFDCEFGNSVLFFLVNVFKVLIVVFSFIDSYFVIFLVLRSFLLIVVFIYVVFN